MLLLFLDTILSFTDVLMILTSFGKAVHVFLKNPENCILALPDKLKKNLSSNVIYAEFSLLRASYS